MEVLVTEEAYKELVSREIGPNKTILIKCDVPEDKIKKVFKDISYTASKPEPDNRDRKRLFVSNGKNTKFLLRIENDEMIFDREL